MNSRLIIAIATSCIFITCKEQKTVDEVQVTETTEEVAITEDTGDEETPILLGTYTRDALEAHPYNTWFAPNYKDHTLDKEALKDLEKQIENTQITIFMGTWCEDSQREVPAFFRILDEIDYPSSEVNVVTISEDKTEPAALVKDRDITNVPTLIFTKESEELGRIVEYPLESLEKDMSKILSGQEYEHAYEE